MNDILLGLGLVLLIPLFVSLNQIILNELMPDSFDGSDWLFSYPVSIASSFCLGMLLLMISNGVI